MVSGVIPALILVGGLAFLVSRAIPDISKGIDDTGKAIQQGLEGAGQAVTDFGAGIQQGINEGLEGIQQGFDDAALGAQDWANDVAQGFTDFFGGFAPPANPAGRGGPQPAMRGPPRRQPGRRTR